MKSNDIQCCVRELRERLNLTQKQMAERIGILEQSYQKYELGERFPKPGVIAKICKEFNVDIQDILKLVK